jgi:hypothetical protein
MPTFRVSACAAVTVDDSASAAMAMACFIICSFRCKIR